MRRACLAALLGVLAAAPAGAQDWTGARTPATTVTDPLELPIAARDSSGRPATSLPHHQAGVWRFRAGPYGWPQAFSLDGAPPAATQLVWGGVDLSSPLGGDAQVAVVPSAWTPRPRADGVRLLAPLDSFDAPQPLTHLRYLSGDEGLERVELVHAQARTRTIAGKTGLLRARGGYFGASPENAYANTDVRRGRALLGWADFTAPGLHASLRALHTRHAVGAPGGFEPPIAADPGSIYLRQDGIPLAQPRLASADRRSVRTDLTADVRAGRWRGSLTRTLLRREFDADTLLVGRARRWEARLERGALYADLSRTTPGDANAWADAPAVDVVEAGTRLRWRGVEVQGGAWYGGGAFAPVGQASVQLRGVRLEAELGATAAPLLARAGWSTLVAPTDSATMRWLRASAQARGRRGAFDGWARLFVWSSPEARDWRETMRDVARYDTIGAAARGGLALGLGWRMTAERGLYGWGEATARHALAGPDDWRDALPQLHGSARAGVRLALFRRDLLLDLHAVATGWSAHGGRSLHNPTGLYTLPYPDALPITASATLDLWLTARVRTATLFYGSENVLSGTSLLRGNLRVPDQPLPAARVRFGVFWPIDG